jgi:hypothetical protein
MSRRRSKDPISRGFKYDEALEALNEITNRYIADNSTRLVDAVFTNWPMHKMMRREDPFKTWVREVRKSEDEDGKL